jgi:hypothetical protein
MRGSKSIAAIVALAALTLSGCATVIDGKPAAVVAPNSSLKVVGDSGSSFDTTVKNALSDVVTFWTANFPAISGGKSLPPLKGGFYSIDGASVVDTGKVTGPAAKEGCVADQPDFIVDNAAYCRVDDSIVWDRNPDHLIGVLSDKYGTLMVAMAFAHEFGHALQQRLGIFNQRRTTIDTESQADCAAGAFMGQVMAGKAAHFRATPAQLDLALNGFLQVRDPTPVSSAQISHGNGFDRVSAIGDGMQHGPTFCYSPSYFNRQFTERPFTDQSDYVSGGNETLAQVLDPRPNDGKGNGGGGLQPDLNRFWTAAAKSTGKTWKDVSIAEADHPKCGAAATSEFGYCPDDNTVYYSSSFASVAYDSLTSIKIDRTTGNVTLVTGQPADYALGELFAMAWGLAVRHQLFNRTIDDKDALLAAACYSGAYAKDINIAPNTQHLFTLSPPDMDEATFAMLNLVGEERAFGARGTTGLQRVQSFVKGYQGGLSVC